MTVTIDPIHGGINYWWNLSHSQQHYYAELLYLTHSTTKWTWELTKHESGYWCFSAPDFGIINETLCGGTEKCIDTWYQTKTGNKPELGDTLTITVSSEKLNDFDTEWSWCHCDPDWSASNVFLDSNTKQWVWLCPLLQVLFKKKPLNLWLKFG